MKKILVGFLLGSVTCICYGEAIPLANLYNCTEVGATPEPPSVCGIFLFAATNRVIHQGDTFNISCTFSPGFRIPEGIIPGDIMAMVDTPVKITSGPAIAPNKWTPIPTQGSSSSTFSWTGIALEETWGVNFGISFGASDLKQTQTILVNCTNN